MPHSVLIVEDSVSNQKFMEILLKNMDLHSDFAINGIEAYEMCITNSYDLIFMDCQLPLLDGYNATRKIRQYGVNQESIIIAMTADVMEETRNSCIRSGMNDFISKPIAVRELNNKIHTWLYNTRMGEQGE